MTNPNEAKLQQLGLSSAEAQIYLTLLHHGPQAAAAIANETGIKRTSVYPVICSLTDKGLIEGGTGHGVKFAAIAPAEALPSLVAREKRIISDRERIADELAETLSPLAANAETSLDDSVQVVRTPQVIADRLHRLQLEAERQVELVVKAPIMDPRPGNPAQKKAQRRGVHYRCLYERAVLEDPRVKPYLAQWIAAGEEARVYDGELPYKFAVFDSKVVLLTLVRRNGQSSALLVRHALFAKSISTLFDSFWREAKPLIVEGAHKHRRRTKLTGRRPAAGALNGQRKSGATTRA